MNKLVLMVAPGSRPGRMPLITARLSTKHRPSLAPRSPVAAAPAPTPSSRAARSARSPSRPTARCCSPSTRRTTASRSSRSGAAGSGTAGSVAVGLEPVAVAARSDERGVGRQPPVRQRQRRRRLERRAGPASCAPCSSATSRATSCSPARAASRAFITTAHRGQNSAVDPQLTTPGVGRADVWVFDAQRPRSALGGTPTHSSPCSATRPRALAVSPDGSTRVRRGLPLRQPHHRRSPIDLGGRRRLGRRRRRTNAVGEPAARRCR